MQRPNSKVQPGRKRLNRSLGAIDRLEDRCLLAPVPIFGTSWQPAFGAPVFADNGFVSVRLISSQPGRIEADPTGAFGGDLFVVSRGRPVGTGGLFDTPINAGDQAGFIYRVDPYAVDGFGSMTPAFNRRLFQTIPCPDPECTSFGGYEKWYDLAFDPTGAFTPSSGGPTLFVSILDDETTGAAVDEHNAIYAFRPDGSSVATPLPGKTAGVYVHSTLDAFHLATHDTQFGAIAVAPGDTFGRDLYALDVACDNDPGVSCSAGDGNALYRVVPQAVVPKDLDSAPTAPRNSHVENILPPLTSPPANPPPFNNDIDVRAMVFDPNRGIILQGQNGEPAFQMYGGLFAASTDFETGDTGVSRVLHFPTPGFAPLDMIPPLPTTQRLIGDMAFDPVGHFGGGLFFTDYVTRSVIHVLQDPSTGLGFQFTNVAGFNVRSPTLPGVVPAVTPQDSYRDAFSISFSADGEIMYVSDRDGIWAIYANTLAHTPAGAVIGLTDIRELRAPYTGKGLAAAILDTGVDGAHLGFHGTVTAGFNPTYPGPGNVDFGGHGTAVAGIVHQIAPDSVIVPINLLIAATTDSTFSNEILYRASRYVLDNPTVDDPRTAAIDKVPIVATNMSLGIIGGIDGNLNTELDAFHSNLSLVIALKEIFSRYNSANSGLGIVPVASAGNDGQTLFGTKSEGIPAILNEVVSVAASYPYTAAMDIFDPFGRPLGPPITLPTPANVRCTLEAGDVTAFVGKITAFSNRNFTTDFAAPGTCVSTYGQSLFATPVTLVPLAPAAQALRSAPIQPLMNGTSAAAPEVTGSFVFGYDVVTEWAKIFARGGVVSTNDPDEGVRKLNEYLLRDFPELGLGAARYLINIGNVVPAFQAYLNADGINSLLQWSAVPREDVNIGEAVFNENGTDDDVAQQRLIASSRYRTYSHVNIADLLSVVEGSVALNYFIANQAQLNALDATLPGTPGLVTAAEIEFFVANPANLVEARAMARLLGGTARVANLNRLAYLDLVQDEHVHGGILTANIVALADKLLPAPNEFVIANRADSADKHYAVDSTALRAYHDFNYRPGVLAPRGSKKQRKQSPDQIHFGTGAGGVGFGTFLPVINGNTRPTLRLSVPTYRVVGHAGDAIFPPPITPPIPGNPPGGPSASPSGVDNLVSLNGVGGDLVYHTTSDGSLLEYSRRTDGTWQSTDLTAATTGPRIGSDLVAVGAGASRTIFGLTAGGHVARYALTSGQWTAQDLTASAGLPSIVSSLTSAVVSGKTLLFGLSQSGALIQYSPIGATWSARNITTETRGAALQPGIVAYGQTIGKRTSVGIYALAANGHLIQYMWNGKRWSSLDLSSFATTPIVKAGSLALLNNLPGGVSSLVALDQQGNLWRYRGNMLLGWESVSGQSGAPALTGELAARYDAASAQMRVFGTDSQGRVIEFAGTSGGWSWSAVGSPDPAGTGELMASNDKHAVYAELVDGVIAEYWFDVTWQMRRVSAP